MISVKGNENSFELGRFELPGVDCIETVVESELLHQFGRFGLFCEPMDNNGG